MFSFGKVVSSFADDQRYSASVDFDACRGSPLGVEQGTGKVGQLILEQRWYGLWCALCNLQQTLKENKWIDNDGLIIESHCQFCSKSDGQIFLSDENLKHFFFLSCHPKFSSRYSWHHQHWLCHLQPVHLQCF